MSIVVHLLGMFIFFSVVYLGLWDRYERGAGFWELPPKEDPLLAEYMKEQFGGENDGTISN